MKPLHVGLLVAAGAIAGALIVKVVQRPQPAPEPTAVTTPALAPAQPPAQTEVQPAPATPPSPFAEQGSSRERTRKSKATGRREEPSDKTVAANQPPAAPSATQASQPPASANPADNKPVNPPAQTASEPATPPPPPTPHKVTIAAGTVLPVRLVEGLSTDRNQAGDTFTATLEQPLVVDGFVIAERGSRVEGRVIESDKAGRVKGVSLLSVALTQLHTSDGQRVGIQTQTFTKQGEKSTKSDAAKVGAAAGIGAIIGAIAGGGKGAAIGAGIGGAGGTGTVLATRGKAATLPSETRISFRLSEPITITERLKR